jgi:demethylmenaquinone methyltransferase/2-methoxy-6-polyprenyl-1,4-benzoquinol methylase
MAFRATFDCLWCGRPWRAHDEADLTGWAALCPDCLGRAQDNPFLRFRLRRALRERPGGGATTSALGAVPASRSPADIDAGLGAGSTARTAELDDRYLRRGRYSRGPARDLAWHAELDQATAWLDRQPLSGEIVELAAGTGWWSPLLAAKGELSLYDADPERLDRARERLVAHRLRAHIHVRDPWAEPDREVDALFCGFWLGRVTDERLGPFLALVMRWLRPGGRFAFIDPLPDPESGAVDEDPAATDDTSVRGLRDGREDHTMHRSPEAIADSLRRAGFELVVVERTARFFLLGSAVRPGDQARSAGS